MQHYMYLLTCNIVQIYTNRTVQKSKCYFKRDMTPFCSSVSYSISVLQLLYLGAQCVSVCSQLLRKSKEKNALKLLDQKQLKFFFTTFLFHHNTKISYLIHITAIGSFFISVFYIFIHICTYVSVCFSTCFFLQHYEKKFTRLVK